MKNFGNFSEDTLVQFQDEYSYSRCQRPDGSFYGTSGVCRKGTPADAKEKSEKGKSKSSSSKLKERGKSALSKAEDSGVELSNKGKRELIAATALIDQGKHGLALAKLDKITDSEELDLEDREALIKATAGKAKTMGGIKSNDPEVIDSWQNMDSDQRREVKNAFKELKNDPTDPSGNFLYAAQSASEDAGVAMPAVARWKNTRSDDEVLNEAFSAWSDVTSAKWTDAAMNTINGNSNADSHIDSIASYNPY